MLVDYMFYVSGASPETKAKRTLRYNEVDK